MIGLQRGYVAECDGVLCCGVWYKSTATLCYRCSVVVGCDGDLCAFVVLLCIRVWSDYFFLGFSIAGFQGAVQWVLMRCCVVCTWVIVVYALMLFSRMLFHGMLWVEVFTEHKVVHL